ncbi:DUF6325 family protein [Microterricola viridarii]|uniref:DUF1269 domain-containing family protein n=1 Tax=Microterricola viridarii TaxID=412690 RepID=A0A0X8E0V0_9MICO|nr:DUF6325 family protein [Microterricola viridarii]AMB58255.1 hypothetical protein AWU67_04635 [Microterricola viridarii]
MTLGPVEVLVIGFPENRFTGEIIPELERVVSSGTIAVIDGLFVRKDADGSTTFAEFDEIGVGSEVAALRGILDRVEGLISDEDVSELTAELAPNSSAAILVFEHAWARGLRDAVVRAGGQMLESVRVPQDVVQEILSTVPEID